MNTNFSNDNINNNNSIFDHPEIHKKCTFEQNFELLDETTSQTSRKVPVPINKVGKSPLNIHNSFKISIADFEKNNSPVIIRKRPTSTRRRKRLSNFLQKNNKNNNNNHNNQDNHHFPITKVVKENGANNSNSTENINKNLNIKSSQKLICTNRNNQLENHNNSFRNLIEVEQLIKPTAVDCISDKPSGGETELDEEEVEDNKIKFNNNEKKNFAIINGIFLAANNNRINQSIEIEDSFFNSCSTGSDSSNSIANSKIQKMSNSTFQTSVNLESSSTTKIEKNYDKSDQKSIDSNKSLNCPSLTSINLKMIEENLQELNEIDSEQLQFFHHQQQQKQQQQQQNNEKQKKSTSKEEDSTITNENSDSENYHSHMTNNKVMGPIPVSSREYQMKLEEEPHFNEMDSELIKNEKNNKVKKLNNKNEIIIDYIENYNNDHKNEQNSILFANSSKHDEKQDNNTVSMVKKSPILKVSTHKIKTKYVQKQEQDSNSSKNKKPQPKTKIGNNNNDQIKKIEFATPMLRSTSLQADNINNVANKCNFKMDLDDSDMQNSKGRSSLDIYRNSDLDSNYQKTRKNYSIRDSRKLSLSKSSMNNFRAQRGNNNNNGSELVGSGSNLCLFRGGGSTPLSRIQQLNEHDDENDTEETLGRKIQSTSVAPEFSSDHARWTLQTRASSFESSESWQKTKKKIRSKMLQRQDNVYSIQEIDHSSSQTNDQVFLISDSNQANENEKSIENKNSFESTQQRQTNSKDSDKQREILKIMKGENNLSNNIKKKLKKFLSNKKSSNVVTSSATNLNSIIGSGATSNSFSNLNNLNVNKYEGIVLTNVISQDNKENNMDNKNKNALSFYNPPSLGLPQNNKNKTTDPIKKIENNTQSPNKNKSAYHFPSSNKILHMQKFSIQNNNIECVTTNNNNQAMDHQKSLLTASNSVSGATLNSLTIKRRQDINSNEPYNFSENCENQAESEINGNKNNDNGNNNNNNSNPEPQQQIQKTASKYIKIRRSSLANAQHQRRTGIKIAEINSNQIIEKTALSFTHSDLKEQLSSDELQKFSNFLTSEDKFPFDVDTIYGDPSGLSRTVSCNDGVYLGGVPVSKRQTISPVKINNNNNNNTENLYHRPVRIPSLTLKKRHKTNKYPDQESLNFGPGTNRTISFSKAEDALINQIHIPSDQNKRRSSTMIPNDRDQLISAASINSTNSVTASKKFDSILNNKRDRSAKRDNFLKTKSFDLTNRTKSSSVFNNNDQSILFNTSSSIVSSNNTNNNNNNSNKNNAKSMLSRTVSNTLDTKLSKVVNKILLEKTSSWGYGLFGGNKMQSGSEQVQINAGSNDYERRFHQVSNKKNI